MPGSLQQAAPTSVMPKSLCYSFTETRLYPVMMNVLTDGTILRSMIEDGVNAPRPARTWHMGKVLKQSDFDLFLTFFETTVSGGYKSFYYYDPFNPGFGVKIGENWDGTGANMQGRVTVHFQGNWRHIAGVQRYQIPDITLVEVT